MDMLEVTGNKIEVYMTKREQFRDMPDLHH